jgi:hypothetical protein
VLDNWLADRKRLDLDDRDDTAQYAAALTVPIELHPAEESGAVCPASTTTNTCTAADTTRHHPSVNGRHQSRFYDYDEMN